MHPLLVGTLPPASASELPIAEATADPLQGTCEDCGSPFTRRTPHEIKTRCYFCNAAVFLANHDADDEASFRRTARSVRLNAPHWNQPPDLDEPDHTFVKDTP